MPDVSRHTAGGKFLIDACGARPSFIPEEFDQSQRDLAEMAAEFSQNEVMGLWQRIESQEPGLSVSLMKKAGQLGLLMAEIPEEYGGLGLSKVTSTIIAENMAHEGSFSVTFICHCGIGTLPLLYYGTHEQKQKYLSKLTTDEMIGAYALTEPASGSDALAARTRATLTPDGKHYLLTGEKSYCTNGGFADLFTIFAKVDGEKFTAFLVEKNTPGFTIGPEERKMGILGSSTVPLSFSDAKVPIENVLGEIGRGHKIAFNTLNIGRFKMGAACTGGAKCTIRLAVAQARQRQQFGKAISEFELVRHKIARMVARTYLTESLVYRYAGELDLLLAKLDKTAADYFKGIHDAIEELSVEAAIAKIYGSEALSFVADEAVQIFGGAGFIREFPVEQTYRDCRVYRIFEGTNEICRLIIPGTLIRRAMAGRIGLMEQLGQVLGGLKTGFPKSQLPAPFGALVDQVEGIKRVAVYLTGVAVQKLGERLKKRQSVSEALADLTIESYALDSGLLRAMKLSESGDADRSLRYAAICQLSIAERLPILLAQARQALINIADGAESEYAPYLKALSRLTQPIVIDTNILYDQIASRALDKEGYNP